MLEGRGTSKLRTSRAQRFKLIAIVPQGWESGSFLSSQCRGLYESQMSYLSGVQGVLVWVRATGVGRPSK
jgi:hypothetical protein